MEEDTANVSFTREQVLEDIDLLVLLYRVCGKKAILNWLLKREEVKNA